MNLVLGVPLTYVLSYNSIRLNIFLLTMFNVLGVWLRCLVNQSFWFAFLGHYMLGVSFSFYRSIPSRLSSIWFASEKRAYSSSFMFAFLLSADTLSLYLPNLVIDRDIISIDQYPHYRASLFTYFLVYAIISSIIGIAVVYFFREKPRTPVSYTATVVRLKFNSAFKSLIANGSFVILSFVSAITIACTVCY